MFNAQPMLMGIYPIQYSNISSDLYRVVGSLHTEEPHLARDEAQSEVITFLPLVGGSYDVNFLGGVIETLRGVI